MNTSGYYLLQPTTKVDILADTGAKSETRIRSDIGFSSVKSAENRNFAWKNTWKKANIAINAGK